MTTKSEKARRNVTKADRALNSMTKFVWLSGQTKQVEPKVEKGAK